MHVSTQMIDATYNSQKTRGRSLLAIFSRIQTKDDDVGSPTHPIHVRIGFGKSTLSSRTEVNELYEAHDPIPPGTQQQNFA